MWRLHPPAADCEATGEKLEVCWRQGLAVTGLGGGNFPKPLTLEVAVASTTVPPGLGAARMTGERWSGTASALPRGRKAAPEAPALPTSGGRWR